MLLSKKYLPFSLLLLALLSACTPNKIYRTETLQACAADNCSDALIEQHNTKDEQYDLAFIEFTERGNLFSRDKFDDVLKHIKEQEDQRVNKHGVLLLVYAHGWRNNASNAKKGDVERFRKLLKIINNTQPTTEKRKVIGVYLGWRGLSSKLEPMKTLSYWSRKSVARQVGHGGVSEVLLQLDRILKHKKPVNRNIYIVSGHSFGAAVISAAMKDIMLERLINTEHVPANQCKLPAKFVGECSKGCVKTKPFADSVVLINPALEANEFVQIKELTSQEQCYARQQTKLMRVLSSDSDFLVKVAFGVGQMLGVSTRYQETILNRKIRSVDLETKYGQENKSILIDEYDLDTTSIGHYAPFRTGYSKLKDKENTKNPQYSTYIEPEFKKCYGEGECIDDKEKDKENSLPVSPFEPFSVFYTNSKFIKNHTDIFNEQVSAHMTAAVIENRFKRDPASYHSGIDACFEHGAKEREFKFNKCMTYFITKYQPAFRKEYPKDFTP